MEKKNGKIRTEKRLEKSLGYRVIFYGQIELNSHTLMYAHGTDDIIDELMRLRDETIWLRFVTFSIAFELPSEYNHLNQSRH